MSRFLGIGNGTGTLDLSSYTVIKASCSGTSGTTSLSATNASFSAGQRIFICQMRGTGVGSYEDNKISSYVAGTITLVHPLENTYTDSGSSQAQVVVVPEYGTATGSLTVPAWDGDVGGLFVVSLTQADGTIIGSQKGYRGGARGDSGGQKGDTGEGTTGASVADQETANGNGGGGAFTDGGVLGAEGQGGGGGAYASGAEQGGFHLTNTHRGQPGTEVGQANLTTGLFMGGGGGGGGGWENSAPAASGGVGRAGGAIIVVYAHTLKSSFTVTNVGGAGGNSSGDQGGGGAGAGGTIFIKCVKNLGATLTATGGSRGSGVYGGAGGDGRIRIETCSNTAGTEDPTASVQAGGYSYCGGAAFIY